MSEQRPGNKSTPIASRMAGPPPIPAEPLTRAPAMFTGHPAVIGNHGLEAGFLCSLDRVRRGDDPQAFQLYLQIRGQMIVLYDSLP